MTTITAGTSLGSGLVYDSDTTGNLIIKTGSSATTAATFHGNAATALGGALYASGAVYASSVYLSGIATPLTPLVSGTANTSISGGSIVPFTSIPSSAKRITIMFSGVSTNGTSAPLVQIGTGGSATTSGYNGAAVNLSNGGSIGVNSYTTGFGLNYANPANVIYGHMILVWLTNNLWTASYTFASTGGGGICNGSGSVSLGGTLDYLRVTTVNGTDLFDAGSINIMWE
jgi:predicted outer membrane repeat protein